jgi:hypothetical protein
MSGDFPVMLSNSMASNPAGYLQMYVQGMKEHEQAGTDIPDFKVQQEYAQEQGGPLFQNYEVSGNPSFDVNMPYIPGGRSFEGIPNASPEMLRRFQERKKLNPGGQELFPIKKA